MFTLQKTMTVPAARLLRLDDLLPKTMSAGEVEVTIFIQPLAAGAPAGEEASSPPDRKPGSAVSYREAIDWLRGCCKDSPGTVEEFLANCRADKEYEYEIERRQDEESKRYAQSS